MAAGLRTEEGDGGDPLRPGQSSDSVSGASGASGWNCTKSEFGGLVRLRFDTFSISRRFYLI